MGGNILNWVVQPCDVFASYGNLNTSPSTNEDMSVWYGRPSTERTQKLANTSIVWKAHWIYITIDNVEVVDWLSWMFSTDNQSLFPALAFRLITTKTVYMVAIN